MKRILLLGDSIRMSYQGEVRRQLNGAARVLFPAENGAHSTNLLLNLYDWAIRPHYDVIHVNAGLWDCRKVVPGGPENVTAPDAYRANVRAILTVLRRETDATLIWASTTPVVQERLDAIRTLRDDCGRVNADIPVYNAIAAGEAAALGVPVNDLHAAVMAGGPESMICADGVHYTDAGAARLGEIVADFIRKELGSSK